MPATASVSGEAETATGALVLRGAGVTYPGPPPVAALQPTDLAIEAGSYTAITGPSGSGKSTLLNILGLLDRPTSGTYSIDGQDVHHLGDADLAALRAKRFGFVFQRFHLISSMSAAENVELGLMYAGTPRRQRRERAGAALHRVGLGSRLTHRPTELSGGEQQRVAIARAIVRDPAFLLADEPTGSLDSANAAAVLDLLEDLAAEGRGIVCVTHSDEVAARATSHLTARDGAVSRGPGAD